MLNVKQHIGTSNIVLMTFDSLRFDVAQMALEAGMTPNLAKLLPSGAWELRHSPASFTYPAHHAFFTGFLPTPVQAPKKVRLFAARFSANDTTGKNTFVFDEASLPEALAARAYRTICIGGVAFFSMRDAVSRTLPGLFQERYWRPRFGPSSSKASQAQVDCALRCLSEHPLQQRVFLFINFSAPHHPSHIFLAGAHEDSVETQMAALVSIDEELPRLFRALRAFGDCLVIACSDHGTTFGEDGYHGHRLAHPHVWNVPYAEFVLEA